MDDRTIEAAQHGNRDAQARLIGGLQDIWFRFSLSQLRNADLAAEAAQETALRFLRDLPGFRRDSSLKTWSIGISLNVVRELRRRKQFVGDDATLAEPDRSPSPADVAMSAEAKSQLRHVLANLPKRQRETITLRYFENLSIDETAAAMNVAPGTIKATIHQAMRSLKKRLAE